MALPGTPQYYGASKDVAANFSAPWHRAQLMNIPGYIASHDFPGLATWKASSSGGNELFVDTLEQRELCYLYIVGRIGHTKVKLQPHGNYYDKDTENTSTLSKARLQFNLERPEDDHDFKCDFILAIHRIEELQNAAARDLGTDRRFLVLNDNGSKCLRLSSEIFVAPKTHDSEHHIRNDTYPIAREYRHEYNVALETHDVRILPVWESDGKGGNTLVPPELFSSKLLPGTLVEIAITLRHHHFDNKNTFTGFMHQITIYCPPPPPPPNPFLKTRMQGPVRLSQTPSPKKTNVFPPVAFRPSRSEQTAAVQAFGPRVPPSTTSAFSTPPQFIQGSSSTKRARSPSHTSLASDEEAATTSTLTQSSQSRTDLSPSPPSDVNPDSNASGAKQMATNKKKKTD